MLMKCVKIETEYEIIVEIIVENWINRDFICFYEEKL